MKKNRKFKLLALALVGVVSFFVGTTGIHAITSNQFIFDYEWNYQLPKELKIGENDIVLNGKTTFNHNDNISRDKITELDYKITEITKERYEEFKVFQDKIDEKEEQLKSVKNTSDPDVLGFQNLITTKYASSQYWCYNKPTRGLITVPDFCGTKYYIVTVNARAPEVTTMGSTAWEYMTARVYEVTGTLTTCQDKPEVESPKTGVATPYIALGAVALGAIAIVVISKKKKYI